MSAEYRAVFLEKENVETNVKRENTPLNQGKANAKGSKMKRMQKKEFTWL